MNYFLSGFLIGITFIFIAPFIIDLLLYDGKHFKD